MRWNLKEAESKSLVRRTEITYKARLREISWLKATKSNNYHICSSRVNWQKSYLSFQCGGNVEKIKEVEQNIANMINGISKALKNSGTDYLNKLDL